MPQPPKKTSRTKLPSPLPKDPYESQEHLEVAKKSLGGVD